MKVVFWGVCGSVVSERASEDRVKKGLCESGVCGCEKWVLFYRGHIPLEIPSDRVFLVV